MKLTCSSRVVLKSAVCAMLLVSPFIITGCRSKPTSSWSCAESPEDLAEELVRSASDRDYQSVKKLIFPGVISHFDKLERSFSLNTYIYTTTSRIPSDSFASIVDLRISRILTEKEIRASSGDAYFYELLPGIAGDPIELKIGYEIEGERKGFAVYASESGGCYYLLIPDVTEIWAIDEIEERINKQRVEEDP